MGVRFRGGRNVVTVAHLDLLGVLCDFSEDSHSLLKSHPEKCQPFAELTSRLPTASQPSSLPATDTIPQPRKTGLSATMLSVKPTQRERDDSVTRALVRLLLSALDSGNVLVTARESATKHRREEGPHGPPLWRRTLRFSNV